MHARGLDMRKDPSMATQTALHMAMAQGNVDMLWALIAAGAGGFRVRAHVARLD